MNETDLLQQFIFENAPVRGKIIRLEESFQTIINQHNYPTVLRDILGEMLVVVGLLSASIKFKGRVTLQFQGKHHLKFLLAQCNQKMEMRALAQYQRELDSIELLTELKQGTLAIIMDPEVEGSKRYQGIVAWQGDSLTHSVEAYFRDSEQIPTRLWLAVDQHRAAGFMIQVMPRESARSGKITLEDQTWEHIVHLSATLTAAELLQLDYATLLRRLYSQEDVRIFTPTAVCFRCTCSVTRSENALRLLGEAEANEVLHEKQVVVVKCEFCSKEFQFDRVDVARIFKEGDSGGSAPHVH